MADCIVYTVSGDGGDQLLQEQQQKSATDGGQVEVVDFEEKVELERLPLPHELASSKDDDIVGEEENGRLRHAGHGRLSGHEPEVLGGISSNGLECLCENGPQRDTKRPVKRRRAILEPVWLPHVCSQGVLLLVFPARSCRCPKKRVEIGDSKQSRAT